MKRTAILFLCLLAIILCSSCRKTCRCYRYDGAIEEFDREELKANETTCDALENDGLGLVYSICEYVL